MARPGAVAQPRRRVPYLRLVPPESIRPVQLMLYPPSVMRRQARQTCRIIRYVQAGSLVRKVLTETIETRTHAGDDKPGGRQWAERAVHRELDTAPYLDDLRVRRFVLDHPDGASLDEIAVAMNLSKEGVAGCERRALRKILQHALDDEPTFQWCVVYLGLTEDFCLRFIERRLEKQT